uniref:Uncharacterized protein n=1 Tax=Rhizophora mucronata TaxID=61149 RepID=A0A2P2N4G1_RHIMU
MFYLCDYKTFYKQNILTIFL